MRHRSLVAIVALAFVAPAPLALGWGNDAQTEPSTPYDVQKYMWQTPNDRTQVVGGVAPDRIYFNVQEDTAFLNAPNADFAGAGRAELNGRITPAPVVTPVGILGFWRDCNNDGYIGDRVTGLREYPRSVSAVDTTVCPPGSPYNPGTTLQPPIPWGTASGPMVHELLGIGPDNQRLKAGWSVNDTAARVWGDLNRPDMPAGFTVGLLPLPRGTLDTWNGHIRFLDETLGGRPSTEYAKLYELLKDPDPNDQVNYDLPDRLDNTTLKDERPRTPLYSVARLYGQESKERPEGRPAVRVWQCDPSDPSKDPTLQPGTDVGVNTADGSWSGGSVGDSVNNTVKGIIVRPPDREPVRVGQGCDGSKGDPAVLNDGASLEGNQRLQREEENNVVRKDRTDFYFTYTPPSVSTTTQITPNHLFPSAYTVGASGIWESGVALFHARGVTGASWWTWYAYVNATRYPASAFPGAVHDPVQNRLVAPAYRYGEEACTSPATEYNEWDCSTWPLPSEAWKSTARDTTNNAHLWRVVLGQVYQLRDTDCHDLSPVAPATVTPLRRELDQQYHETVTSLVDGVPPAAQRLWTSYCS